jgi:cation:H+ antiporter
MTSYIFLIIGFALLVKGADILVDGATSVARRFGVSDLVIGLTVVSIGSSSPELIVNVIASLRGNTDLAVGNVLGSNTANILLGLGVAAIIYNLKVQKSTIWKEIPFSLLAVLVMAIMANDALIDGRASSAITRGDGLVFLSFFLIFFYYVYSLGKAGNESEGDEGEKDGKKRSMATALLMVAGGGIGLTIGGKWVVDGAMTIGRGLGVSEALMGLTVVAIGTSLPEIVTSAVAAYRKSADIAVGNVVGSNIFNIFWVLGLASLIRPIPFSPELNTDILTVVLATTLLFIILFVGRRHTIARWEGGGFIVLYVAYLAYLIHRG